MPGAPRVSARRVADMDRARAHGCIEPGARPVEEAIAQHQTVERGRKHLAFQAGGGARRDTGVTCHRDVEGIAFAPRLGPGGGSKGEALRHQPGRAGRHSGVHQVARALCADTGVEGGAGDISAIGLQQRDEGAADGARGAGQEQAVRPEGSAWRNRGEGGDWCGRSGSNRHSVARTGF